MFDQLKQLAQLKSLQSQIAKEKFEAEFDGVKTVVNGGLTIEEISLNPSLDLQKQSRAVKESVNRALKEAQSGAARKLSEMMK
ncbi:MAG: hypothetical protein UV40_C0009G0004 [Parcubacteria group bacterium GW2011_GWA1_42_7]|nr:MAG: hypothetical protein UV40_C0009G0004 [Parcubacteria group bacterium GW2011_GWA1_42_7]